MRSNTYQSVINEEGANSIASSLRDKMGSPQPTQEAAPAVEQKEEAPEQKPEEKPADESTPVDAAPEQKTENKPQEAAPSEHKPSIPDGYVKKEEIENEYSTKLTDYEKKLKEREQELEKIQSQSPFVNDYTKKINDLAANGVDIKSPEFWKFQSYDFNNVDLNNNSNSMELLVWDFKTKNPDVDENLIVNKLKRKYKAAFSPDDYDEDEVQAAREDLSLDALTAKKDLMAKAKDYELPEFDNSAQEEREKQAKIALQNYNESAEKSLAGFSKIPLKFGDSELEYEVTPELKDKVLNGVKAAGTGEFLNRWVNADGTVNYEKMAREIAIIESTDEIIKVIANQNKSVGREEVVQDLKNTNFEQNSSSQAAPKKTKEDMIRESLLKNRGL